MKVLSVGKVYGDQASKKISEPLLVYTMFEDQSIQFQKPHLHPEIMEVITTIYNPPSGKKVLSVAYSTYAQLFMCLMNSGALCMYKLTKGGASKL